jgi:hypothetical protein
MDASELSLPYYGNIEEAMWRGDEKAKEQIMRWRVANIHIEDAYEPDDLDCSLEITFINTRGFPKEPVCAILPTNINPILRNKLPVIPFGDKYLLSEDIGVISDTKITAIPLGNGIYSLVSKEDYEKKFTDVLYNIYTYVCWKIKNKKPSIIYQSFVKYNITNMMYKIREVVSGGGAGSSGVSENTSKRIERSYELNA